LGFLCNCRPLTRYRRTANRYCCLAAVAIRPASVAAAGGGGGAVAAARPGTATAAAAARPAVVAAHPAVVAARPAAVSASRWRGGRRRRTDRMTLRSALGRTPVPISLSWPSTDMRPTRMTPTPGDFTCNHGVIP